MALSTMAKGTWTMLRCVGLGGSVVSAVACSVYNGSTLSSSHISALRPEKNSSAPTLKIH